MIDLGQQHLVRYVPVVDYAYNGAGQVVGTNYPETGGIMWFQYGSTSGDYPDLDRFNRVVQSRWTRDLATDVDFYSVIISYDRNSNVTLVDDQVHAGFDVSYTIDDLNRVTRAHEGTWTGSITSPTRDQQWTLDQVGNWDVDKVDLNGDTDFVDTDELNDDRTHNDVNELTARDIDDDSSDDYTLSYDAVGNMTDDGENYEYVWDVFGRLREINDTGDQSLVAEYRYNGLGYRIAVHEDTDDDDDVDGSDLWYYDAFDERWRDVARFRESDTTPKEEFIYHAAGADGLGRSSYIDLFVLRDKDGQYTDAADGTLEGRAYYCQNWRADMSVIVGKRAQLRNWIKYSAYGVPFGIPGADTDSDGDCDSTDVTQLQTWIDGPTYSVLGDIDLDGDVDADDKSTIQSGYEGDSGGRGVLTPNASRHRRGDSGCVLLGSSYQHRRRLRTPTLGVWLTRDPLGYAPLMNMYQFGEGNPIANSDPSGLTVIPRPPAMRDYILCLLNCMSGCSAKFAELFHRVHFGDSNEHRVFALPVNPDPAAHGNHDASQDSEGNYLGNTTISFRVGSEGEPTENSPGYVLGHELAHTNDLLNVLSGNGSEEDYLSEDNAAACTQLIRDQVQANPSPSCQEPPCDHCHRLRRRRHNYIGGEGDYFDMGGEGATHDAGAGGLRTTGPSGYLPPSYWP